MSQRRPTICPACFEPLDEHGKCHYGGCPYSVEPLVGNDTEKRNTSPEIRYICETRWCESVEPPKLLNRFWFTQMLWHVLIHRRCSLVTYHNASGPFMAKIMAYEYVMTHMPGPQHFHRCKVRPM